VAGLHDEGTDAALAPGELSNDSGGPLREDPVTESLNASVAQWLVSARRVLEPQVARQGARMGRDKRATVTEAAGSSESVVESSSTREVARTSVGWTGAGNPTTRQYTPLDGDCLGDVQDQGRSGRWRANRCRSRLGIRVLARPVSQASEPGIDGRCAGKLIRPRAVHDA